MLSIVIREEDLAAMRAADAEIDAEFRLTPEDIALSRNLDRAAAMEKLDNRERRIAESQRAYYEANRERIAEYQRAYREAYREANRERIAEYQRAYREAYREANRERIAESKRAAIVDFRRSHGMKQLDFAKAVGVSKALVSHWECGRTPINPDKVGAVFPMLAEALRKEGTEP